MKTRMMKCFAIMFAFATVGYMAVSMGRVRAANAEDSAVADTSGSSTTSDTSGTSSSDSDKEDDEDKKDSGGSSSGGCCG